MTDGKGFRQYLREERQKLRAMSFREKRQHIWEYYKLQIILLILAVFLIYQLGSFIINPPPRDYLYIAWIGAPAAHEQLANLQEELSPVVTNPQRYRISVSDYSATGDPTADSGLQQRFTAMMHVGAINLVISSAEGIADMARMGWLQVFEDNLPMVVSLAGSPIIASVEIDCGDLYISVMRGLGDSERIDRLLEFLLYGETP